MSPTHPIGPQQARQVADEARDGFRHLQRRTLVFAVVGLLVCVALVAAFEPSGWQPRRIATLDLLARAHTGGYRFDMRHAPALLAMGAGAGVLAGLLGMGGGVMKVAGMLVLFQLDILLARAVSLVTMFLASASAARVHLGKGQVSWPVVRAMAWPAGLSLIVGMVLGDILPRATLTHFFAFFTLFLGLSTLAQLFVDPHEILLAAGGRGGRAMRGASGIVGTLHGFVCGMLGISGGVVAVPLQQALLGIPARTAVGHTVLVSACITGIGSVAAVGSGVVQGQFHVADVIFASACIGGGAVVGAQVGARMTSAVHVVILKLMFVQVTFTAAGMILFK